MSHPNPYELDGKWYWFDELEGQYGPYETYEQADEALKNYVSFLNSDTVDDFEEL